MIIFPVSVKRILVTGGSGFIGRILLRRLLKETNLKVYNLDKCGYASDLDILNLNFDFKRLQTLKIDLSNSDDTKKAIDFIDPDIVFHLAAESHVDRSILGPRTFLESNIIGTFNLLEALSTHWQSLSLARKKNFKLLHVSTDEVFGSLEPKGFFSENSSYDPRSPYSATKAASDHLVKAWNKTYGIPILITNCGNNFGPGQFPEKLIPVIINNAINNKKIPIYGDGKNVRDWIYVEDHIDALLRVVLRGSVGESYCIGAGVQKSNNEIVELICDLLDKQNTFNAPHNRFKSYIKDRPGHDSRYAIDYKKISDNLKWKPKYNFENALELTIRWYLKNVDWCNKFCKK